MTYILYHKDIPVLTFSLENDEVTAIEKIISHEHLPIGVFKDYEKGIPKKQQFSAWWKSRSIPASRQNIQNALETLGNITTDHLIVKNYGLSLSDQYWARPEGIRIQWEDINFFENSFSEDIGKALFGTLAIQDVSSINFVSPDNTSDGWLKKKWIIDNQNRVLLKGGSGFIQQEPFNELFASEICKLLNIPHVEYSVIEQNERFYSACNDFIDKDTELISALYIRNTCKKSNNDSEFTHLIHCCEELGMDNIETIKKQICDMIVLDSIVANEDRHFNNFGFIRNANTLKWQGLAPVYDTGTSLFLNETMSALEKGFVVGIENSKSKPFAKTHAEQLKKLPCSIYSKDLSFSNLENIDNIFHSIFIQNKEISQNRIDLLYTILQTRIQDTKRMILEPDMKLK